MLHDIRDAEGLSYVDAVAFETMRLKAVFPVLFLGANKDVELGGVFIPEGTAIFLLIRQCGMQETEFTAANQFQPERWLGSHTAAQSGHNTKAFVPFGAGPRFCPGRNLALLEIKAAMSMLCHNFTVSKIAGAKHVEEAFDFLMAPTNLSIDFQKRGSHHGPDGDHEPLPAAKCPFATVTS
jgi:cytochrome P450